MTAWCYLPEHEQPSAGEFYWITIEDSDGSRWVDDDRYVNGQWMITQHSDSKVIAWQRKNPMPEPFLGEVPR